MASEVVHRIEQKLLGHELIYNQSGKALYAKELEGTNNIMASGMLRLPRVNPHEEKTIEEMGKLNEEEGSINMAKNIETKDVKGEPSPSTEWIESGQLSVTEQVKIHFYFSF